MSVKAAKHARELLLKEYRGVLSTHSKAMPGFPFGSVVPYCLDAQGRPLILISRIAQHTHNLKQDAKCSLFVGERGAEDVQAVGRLTLLAEARQLCDQTAIDAAAARYYRYFPESQNYHRAHDFDFWVLEPVRWRYIGGFGAIHWLAQVAQANPFAEAATAAAATAGGSEQGMLEHMNADHASAIAHYVALAGLPSHAPAELVGIDSEGFHLRIGQGLYWLAFAASCNTPVEVRQAFVQLAHAETWPTDGAALA
ncbi:HugZ family protein [Pseudomonas sp.]|uniref:HugZ family pyridoxamine 5'-phosphate oxidase n=1 Tax=Pseudomonas sp. TaxID=306 RepID=UPI00299D9BA0|nr:HugZ family protein [Pseudomonas sp.]MDX1366365.1 HugZ family protein [Pseudomonas sp.]